MGPSSQVEFLFEQLNNCCIETSIIQMTFHFYRNKFFSSIENINIIILMCPFRLKLEIFEDLIWFWLFYIKISSIFFYSTSFYYFLNIYFQNEKYSLLFLFLAIQFISKNHFLSCNQIKIILIFLNVQSRSFHSSKYSSNFNSFLIRISLNNFINNFILK